MVIDGAIFLSDKIKSDPDKPDGGSDVKPKLKKKKKLNNAGAQGSKTTDAAGKPRERRPKVKKEKKIKEELVMMDESDDSDEDCAANKCLKPIGNCSVEARFC